MPIRFGGNIGFNKQIGGVNVGVNIPIFGDRRNRTIVGRDTGTKKNSIRTIIAKASEANLYARPNIYNVRITPPNVSSLDNSNSGFNSKWSQRRLENIAFNCDTISIPGQNLSTKPNKTYSLKKEYVYDKIYDTVNATFYVSEALDEYHFFEDWQKLMFDQRTGDLGWYNNYKGTLVIDQLTRLKKKDLGEDLATSTEFTLVDAYPKTVSPLRLGYALNNQVLKVDVQFAYRTMISKPKSSETASVNLFNTNPLDKKSSLFRNLNLRGGFKLFGRNQRFEIFNKR